MSHSKLRTDTTCLNCGAQVTGRYCNQCGQENTEPEPNLWHLVVHFFNDFTHFDGKFFSTIKLLLLKPGFLSLEYKKGRRAAYLDPVRMYIFTSAIAFLVVFSVGEVLSKRVAYERQNKEAHADTGRLRNSNAFKKLGAAFNKWGDSLSKYDTTFEPQTVAQYDSFQKTLPAAERDGSVDKYFNRRFAKSAEKSDDPTRNRAASKEIWQHFFHLFPQMLFVSLPFFALILYMVNFRRRKQYRFVSHAIFTIHYYCTTYILLMISFALLLLPAPYGFWLGILPMCFVPFVYLYLSMKRFYGQGHWKTLIKFTLTYLLSTVVTMILFAIYFTYSLLALADS